MKLKHCHQSHWEVDLSRLLLAIERAQAHQPGEQGRDEGCTAPTSPVPPHFMAGEPAPPMHHCRPSLSPSFPLKGHVKKKKITKKQQRYLQRGNFSLAHGDFIEDVKPLKMRVINSLHEKRTFMIPPSQKNMLHPCVSELK